MALSSGKSKTNNKNKKEKTRSNSTSNVTTRAQTQRNKCPGFQLIGGRIYDSQSGKTCHQCRQKTMDFVASCKIKTKKKQCTFHFCHRCLLNRYGEKTEEVAALHNWMCPKCRGICNCSFCMKKRGQHPTGNIVRTAQAIDFSSVSEMLHLKDSDNSGSKNTTDAAASSKKQRVPNEESCNSLAKSCREGNGFQRPSNSKVQVKPSKMGGVKLETRSSKLKRLRDNNGNEIASGDSRDDDSLTQKSSPKRHQTSKGAGKGFQRPSNSVVQAKSSKLEGIGIETRSTKSKRLRAYEGSENVSGDKNDAASVTKNRTTKRHQIPKGPSGGKEKIYQRDHGGRLIRMNPDMKIPNKDFQESINDHSEIEVPNNVDIDDTIPKHKAITGSQSLEEKNIVEVKRKSSDKEIPLPHGIILSSVASIDIPAEDVGHAFQFLEFCEAFGQVLNLGKGRSKQLLRELACGRSKRRVHSSSIIQFHIQLLSVIQKNLGKEYPYFQKVGENSWLQVLVRYVSESHFSLKELQADCCEVGDYDQLDISKKLKLLNFLCDEALGTKDFRSWIDKQNSKFVEREKKVKEKVLTEKEKKKTLQDDIAKACLMKNGAPLSISEHVDLVSKIKLEVAQTLAKTVEPSDAMFEELSSDALRLEPMFLDGHGHKFWRLNCCYSKEMNILLQDIGKGDLVAAKERWYTYDIEQKAQIEKYISSFRQMGK